MPEINGGFSGWVLGIVAGLILTAIVGSIIFERDVAKTLGEHEERLKYLSIRIDEKTASRFSREDFDREKKIIEGEQQRIDRRLNTLEARH
jgi:hypothetical protein